VKYVIVIIDGASGWPASALEGRTALEAAHTPNLDRLAREGSAGMVDNVPPGMEPSSAIACMSVMGFDPTAYYAGRGPIEAMAMGIGLEPGEVAMRCNFVTVVDGKMASYSAGNINSEESAELVAALREGLGDAFQGDFDGAGAEHAGSASRRARMALYAGVGFRQILTVRDGAELLVTSFTTPHDIADRPVAGYQPVGPGAHLVGDLMERSKGILAGHPVNKARIARGELPATQIWLFWPGTRPAEMPTFSEIYGGRKAAMTSGVDLLRGLAIQTGMDVLTVPGVTDRGDNDYRAQMAGALEALDDHDVVFVHVEAPDEASHSGDVAGKVRAIEQTDRLIISQVLDAAEHHAGLSGGLRLMVLPDHPTPLEIKTHVAEPVPFVMWGPGIGPNRAKAYTETAARATGFAVAPGHRLMSLFLAG